jgi:hypothetical protein
MMIALLLLQMCWVARAYKYFEEKVRWIDSLAASFSDFTHISNLLSG